jgi:hypothetical protein
MRSRRIGWLVPFSGAVRALPQLFLSACSTLEHLGEPLASYPFRFLRLSAAASIIAKAVGTPLFLARALAARPELHQPELLPRKVRKHELTPSPVGCTRALDFVNLVYSREKIRSAVNFDRILTESGFWATSFGTLPADGVRGRCASRRATGYRYLL